ncbi:MAG: gentisate 1,2-dioxygenase [Chromatiales bacterium]|nr:gentisate 1,2-dioxygenase [Chromatiales bacterium]
MAPLWEVLKGLLPAQPQAHAQPYHWVYDTVRPLLLESGALLTAQEAERRVLVLENPAYVGQSKTTASLYAGIQLVLPGETAPAHRHTPSALRFVLEGTGGFTAVDGERTTMHPGDFVITPPWAWHDHGNDGDGPVAWLDGLDIPMMQFFEAVFTEHSNALRQSSGRPEGDCAARFGSGLMPIGYKNNSAASPIFNYPYDRTRNALLACARGEAPDPHTGVTMRYVNPVDGGWAMPTLATWMTHLPAGSSTAAIRSTDSMVMTPAEGECTVEVGQHKFTLKPRDVLAIPGWMWRSITAKDDCFLFFFSDRVIHEKLGFFREERAGL